MAPAPGELIVDTLLSVYLSADGQTVRNNRNQWILNSFTTDEILASRNKLKNYLSLADSTQFPATRKSVDNALNDIGTWVREMDNKGEEMKTACAWTDLQRAATLLANQELLGPDTVVPLSSRMGNLESQMKDVINSLNKFQEETVKRWSLSGHGQPPSSTKESTCGPTFASIVKTPTPAPLELGIQSSLLLQPSQKLFKYFQDLLYFLSRTF